jgi:hypothetical protein
MNSVLQIKITLKGSKPPIWRRVQIASTSSFADLHGVIRDAMGWDGSHLHGFAFEQKQSRFPILIGPPSQDSMIDTLHEKRELVTNWLGKKAEQCLYTYDYGDDWDHIVLLEKTLPIDPEATYPRCIDGKRACPPDDCGGIWGYYDKLKVLKDPTDAEYEETVEWMGENFDPDAFDPAAVKFLGAVEPFSPWGDDEEDEDEEEEVVVPSLNIEIEDALHGLDHPGAKVSFEAIEFMRNSEAHKQLVDHIVFVLDKAYDRRSIQLDMFHDTSPLWYAVVAEAHLDERLIEPTVRLVTTTENDWELLSEQAHRLICLLAEKFPDKTTRAVMDAIEQTLQQNPQTPYPYLLDAFAIAGIEKHKDWLLKLADNPDNTWTDSVARLLEPADASSAKQRQVDNRDREDWRLHYAGFRRDLADAADDDMRFVSNLPYVAPPKVGRNEPCPCGSGKKYKKCHGANL